MLRRTRGGARQAVLIPWEEGARVRSAEVLIITCGLRRAVDRNRVRRRVRAALRDLLRAGDVAPGEILIRVGQEELALPFQVLRERLRKRLEVF
ncbi:MAG: hypothetical protein D6679_04370 [Candidatus Hydrogenedentota bacterium]|nr:MAG: hypothetical protein D6679_04370 [Candidatus Hydrogenedentota bacterium]